MIEFISTVYVWCNFKHNNVNYFLGYSVNKITRCDYLAEDERKEISNAYKHNFRL